MASEKEQTTIPSWDGSARTWRRYTREVCWYVTGTAVERRRYCAGRLRGPARLLAMCWTTMEFDHPNGVREVLQKLTASPLVRQTLPNAAATCQHTSASAVTLARQWTTSWSEKPWVTLNLSRCSFCEDKQGIRQQDKNFDLPEQLPSGGWQDWWYDADEPDGEDPAQAPVTSPTSPTRPTATTSPSRATAAADGAGDGTGMLPTRHVPRAPSLRSVGVPGTNARGLETGDFPWLTVSSWGSQRF